MTDLTDHAATAEEFARALVLLDRYGAACDDSAERARVVEVLGVVGGVKSAAYIEVSVPEACPDVSYTLEDLFPALGLQSHSVLNGIALVVARDGETITAFTQALDDARSEPAEAAERRIGALLGYPTTATDYYLKRSATMNTSEQLPMIDPDDVSFHPIYSGFVMSPEHYSEEIEAYCTPLERAVQQLTPLFHEVLEHDKDELRAEHSADVAEINS